MCPLGSEAPPWCLHRPGWPISFGKRPEARQASGLPCRGHPVSGATLKHLCWVYSSGLLGWARPCFWVPLSPGLEPSFQGLLSTQQAASLCTGAGGPLPSTLCPVLPLGASRRSRHAEVGLAVAFLPAGCRHPEEAMAVWPSFPGTGGGCVCTEHLLYLGGAEGSFETSACGQGSCSVTVIASPAPGHVRWHKVAEDASVSRNAGLYNPSTPASSMGL